MSKNTGRKKNTKTRVRKEKKSKKGKTSNKTNDNFTETDFETKSVVSFPRGGNETVSDVPSETETVKSQQDLFEYEGKHYAIGSIVSVGYGPYFAKKRRYRKRKKAGVIPIDGESTIDDIIPDNVENGEEQDDVDGVEWQGEYGADKPDKLGGNQDDENDVGSDEDDPSSEGIIKPVREAKPKRKKVVWEDDEIFKEKEVDILEGEALAIAKEMGLPYKKSKLVPEPIKYKVVEQELRYRGYDKFIVSEKEDANGKSVLYLKPYSPPRVNKINVFDGDYLPPPVPVYVHDNYVNKTEPPSFYKGSFKLGDRITFTLSESKEVDVEGIVLRVTDTTFTVVRPDGKNGTFYFDVEYKNAQNLRFKPVPDKYLNKKSKETREIHIGKKVYYVDDKTITSKDNYLAKQSRKYPFKYAEFTLVEPKIEHLEGIIMDYAENHFIVSTLDKNSRAPSKTVDVSYNNQSIKKIAKKTSIKDVQKGVVNAADYLHLPVETSTRLNTAKRLFSVLSSILEGIYESPTDSDPLLEKLGNQINWTLANSKFESWDDYYNKQIKAWLFSKLYSGTFEKAPSFLAEAQAEHASSVDPFLIIEGLTYTFGDIFDGNAARCLAIMNSKAKDGTFQPTIIDIAIRRELTKLNGNEGEFIEEDADPLEGKAAFLTKDLNGVEKEIVIKGKGKDKKKDKKKVKNEKNGFSSKITYKSSELENIYGVRLASMIAHIISRVLQTNPPPNVETIQLRMKHDWVLAEIDEHVVTKKERREFDDKYVVDLQNRYEQYEKEWKDAKLLKSEYNDLKKMIDDQYSQRGEIQKAVPRLRAFAMETIDGRQLSERGLLLADNVSMLEETIYIDVHSSADGSTNEKYLYKMCELMMFLDPTNEIGKYANFFRSKITSGMYSVDQLGIATQFHLFPEFFANTNNSDDIYNNGSREIEKNVKLDVVDFIDISILGNAPRIRNTTFGAKFIWSNVIESPSKACGGIRMKPDAEYRGVEDAQNYDCEMKENDMYECKAKLEPIPDEDLILCYDDHLHKFTCASINDVLYALWDQDQGNVPINPMTERPYGDDFLDRMRDRYEDLYDAKYNTFTKKVIKFTASMDRLLFGGDEPEEIIY